LNVPHWTAELVDEQAVKLNEYEEKEAYYLKYTNPNPRTPKLRKVLDIVRQQLQLNPLRSRSPIGAFEHCVMRVG
jgi:hypothetical protein